MIDFFLALTGLSSFRWLPSKTDLKLFVSNECVDRLKRDERDPSNDREHVPVVMAREPREKVLDRPVLLRLGVGEKMTE